MLLKDLIFISLFSTVSTCQLKERISTVDDGLGCVSTASIRQTWCAGHCGSSTDEPILAMQEDGTWSDNSCKCCSGIPGKIL